MGDSHHAARLEVAPEIDLAPFVPRLLLRRPSDAPRHWRVEGTTVFIDISGFTRLSEQLARRGRVGAEDLVATLTRIFTLLMSATDDGGDVVKFAGDALLIVYTGPDHERRACHAAIKSQQVLGVVGDVRLAGARARLRMSVGVHSGVLHLLLTGHDSQNLVVTGPTLDRVLALEATAAAGQVLVSHETAAALPAAALGEAVGDGLRLRRAPSVEPARQDGFATGSPDSSDALLTLLPAVFSARPDLLTADSDHRRAAMAFVQVGGLGVELARDPLPLVDRLTEVVEDACRESGATLLDIDIAPDGFRYFLTCGAPVSVEDAEGRLLQALLRVTTASTPFVVRAGVSTGQVFAGPVGPTFRRTFSVMGDTTNLAARLTARADAGTVLAHQDVTRRSSTAFVETTREPIRVKGQSEPLPVTVVTGIVGPRPRRGSEPPFVGRAVEIETLGRVLARAAEGAGHAVEVAGDAGIGKSRLVAQALEASGLPTLTVVSDPYGSQVPYRLVGLLLREVLGLGRSDPPETVLERLTTTAADAAPATVPWLPLVAPLLDVTLPATTVVTELDPRFRTARLHAVLGELLDGVLREPTVVVVDNAQWNDPSSSAALAALLKPSRQRRWSLVIVRRERSDPEVEPTLLTRLTLEPLATSAAEQLLAAVAPELAAHRRRSVLARAGGNPYLLLELATADLDAELPDSVEALVAVGIDALDSHDRDLLRQAAVLGGRFTSQLFARTTGTAELDRRLRAGSGSGLTRYLTPQPDRTVSFRRALEREVAYGQLTFRRRREVHGRAAEAIEEDPALVDAAARLPLLSLHSFESARWPAAFAWSQQATARAQGQYANEEAATFARRALDAGRRAEVGPAQLAEVEERLGDVLALTGAHESAVRALRGARRAAVDPVSIAELTYKIGMVQRESGRLEPALATARRVSGLAAGITSTRGAELAIEADLLRAGVRFWQGRCTACQRLTDQVAERAALLPDGPVRTRLTARAWALHDTASIELEGRAGVYGHQPLEMFREVGDLYNEGRFAVNLAVGDYYEGRWDLAIQMYRRSQDIAQRIGDVFGVAVAQMNIGELLALQGDGPAAVELLTESVAGLAGLASPLATAHAALYLSVALRLCGDLAGARQQSDHSAACFTEAGRDSGFSLDDHASHEVELLVAEGRSAEAVRAADVLLDRRTPPAALHRARLLRSRAEALRALGERQRAADVLAAGLVVARDIPLGYETALTLLRRSEWDGDPAAWSAAEEILTGLGCDVAALVGSG